MISGRPSIVAGLGQLELDGNLEAAAIHGTGRDVPAALDLAAQRVHLALAELVAAGVLLAAERGLFGRALGAAARRLLLVEQGRHLVGVEFLLFRLRLGRRPAWSAFRPPCAPAPWRVCACGGCGLASGAGAFSGSLTASASARSATIVSATGSGLTSCLGCGCGVTSVAGTGSARLGLGLLDRLGLAAARPAVGFGSGLGEGGGAAARRPPASALASGVGGLSLSILLSPTFCASGTMSGRCRRRRRRLFRASAPSCRPSGSG